MLDNVSCKSFLDSTTSQGEPLHAGEPLHVIVDKPWANGLANDQGQLHLLTLLQVSYLLLLGHDQVLIPITVLRRLDRATWQDVGLVREVRAAKKPGCPVCGPKGDAYATGESALPCSSTSAGTKRHGQQQANQQTRCCRVPLHRGACGAAGATSWQGEGIAGGSPPGAYGRSSSGRRQAAQAQAKRGEHLQAAQERGCG